MPGIDDLQLADEIKKIPSAKEIPLILLSSTGHVIESDAKANFSAVLNKPVKISRLKGVLCSAIRKGIQPKRESGILPQGADSLLAARHPLKIILAEDNPVNQKVALKMLAKMGYRADLASNGLEVLEALKRIRYDLILMDCQMPEMDGYEATRLIRADEQERQSPPVYIVAMTAHVMEGDREECLVAGMNDYLGKPVREAELREALLRCRVPSLSLDKAKDVEMAKPARKQDLHASRPAPAATAPAAFPNSSAAMPDEPLLDLELLAESAETGPEAFSDLVDLYLAQAREVTGRLRSSISAGAAAEVEKLAHKLAGSSAVCGAKAVATMLRTLEKQGGEGRLSQAGELFDNICRQLEKTEQALADYIQDLQKH